MEGGQVPDDDEYREALRVVCDADAPREARDAAARRLAEIALERSGGHPETDA